MVTPRKHHRQTNPQNTFQRSYTMKNLIISLSALAALLTAGCTDSSTSSVSGAGTGQGTVVAKAGIPVGRRVRLRGRLSGIWSLDGLPLGVRAETELKKKPSIGDYVEVRGRVTGKGAVEAERIRVRNPHRTSAPDDD
jgi:hypothetical protein